ncbi:transglycosylase family protein [Actinomyces weissii]|uniref:Transglycosylase family protein n=1 Tax=Actinomyces weissii TaxID=675090 RepID=A0A7T7M940_9ACTO|nr:transglycosylase family protein [Actinomyces weissii]QQM67145.1 transglycosylase family protein [Actinomyces weissii]
MTGAADFSPQAAAQAPRRRVPSRSSVARAGAVAAAVSLAVSGAAYAAVLQARPAGSAAGADAVAAAVLPAIGQGATPAANTVTFQLVVDGQGREVSTSAGSWGQALLEAGVGVDTAAGDRVSVALDGVPSAGETVVVDRVVVSSESKEDKEAYATVEEETDELDKGERKVKTPGVDGVTRTTYTVRTVGGQEVSREVAAQVVATAKVDEVVLVGTKEKKSSSAPAGAAQALANDDGSLDDDFARLAQCESGGNPRAVNPAGYYGLYQFSLSTWASVGGTGNPIDASPEEQLMRAKILQARSGWGQWGCPH